MRNGVTPLTIVGNMVSEPELRYTQGGDAVLSFRIASTPRVYDKNTQEWVDGETLFLTCNLWRQPAENAAASLTKGMRIIVEGALKQRSYQTKDGEQRISYEIEVEEVGPSLRYATAHVTKVAGGQQGQQGHAQGQQGGYGTQGQGGAAGHQGANWGANGGSQWGQP